MKTVFFDLDGTLLPMDQDAFVKGYFGLLAAKMKPYGYDPQTLFKSIWKGVEAMVRGDGSRRGEERQGRNDKRKNYDKPARGRNTGRDFGKKNRRFKDDEN